MSAQRVATALLLVALACAPPGARRDGSACTRTAYRERPDGLCESVFACSRPPGGRFDRIGLHRLARCDGTPGAPVVLYLPGAHMNGELPAGATMDVRAALAGDALRVWSLDYRTHAVPADATRDDLGGLAAWTADVFADDVAFAARFVRDADPGSLWLAGFSYGAGVAYRLAARAERIDGLVVLDGAPPDGVAPSAGDGPAIDVGGSRLPYPERRRLLAAVLDDPGGPSTVAGFATAGAALATIVYEARAFGGNGGLSAARDGVTDVRALAALMDGYDRWWPRAALGGAAVAPTRALPVIAFASTRMGPTWTERVRAGARAFGGERAAVHVLPGYGHLDVLVGKDVRALVVDPTVAFVTREWTP